MAPRRERATGLVFFFLFLCALFLNPSLRPCFRARALATCTYVSVFCRQNGIPWYTVHGTRYTVFPACSQARRFHECRRAEGVLAVLELARAQALFARKANAAWKQVQQRSSACAMLVFCTWQLVYASRLCAPDYRV